MARSVLALSNCLIMTASSKKDQEWDRANVARVRRQKSWCSSPRTPAEQAVIWLGRRDPGPSRGSTLADIAPTLKRLIASSAVVRSGEGKYAFRRISRMQRHLRPSNRNQGSPKERARVWINDRHASTSKGPRLKASTSLGKLHDAKHRSGRVSELRAQRPPPACG